MTWKRNLERTIEQRDRARQAAVTLLDDFTERKAALTADEYLSEEGKRAGTDRLVEETNAEARRLVEVTRRHQAEAEAILTKQAEQLPPLDATLTADARARVRSALDKGEAASDIRTGAVMAGDRHALAALAHELHYRDVDRVAIEADFTESYGGGLAKDLAAQVPHPHAESIAAAREAERQLMAGDERSIADARHQLDAEWAGIEVDLRAAENFEDPGAGAGAALAHMVRGA